MDGSTIFKNEYTNPSQKTTESRRKMFDIISALMWVTLGVGAFGFAFVEYRLSNKKRTTAEI
jgi:hypothetical protein